ncbi:hypothetical protein DL766_009491 [Monosporascus sp. MC13-8B]|nr:hypothetical protein DL763_005916 [Monosporascus cannonballus]RYP15122.1 hypothetical protein DL766_009491 [Monosporascus sp. MC13-8B]
MCELENPGDDWVRDRGLRHYGQELYTTFGGSRKAFLEQTLEWAQSWFQVRVWLLQHYGRDIWGGPSRATAFTPDLADWALHANAAIHEPDILEDAQFAREKGSATPGEDRSVRVRQLYHNIYFIDTDYASRLGALVTNADGRGTPNLQDIFSWIIRFINRYHLWLKVACNATRGLPPTRTQNQGRDFVQEFQRVRSTYRTVLALLEIVVGERETIGRVQLATFARLRTAIVQGMDDYEKWGNTVVCPIVSFPNLQPNRIPKLENELRAASDFTQGDNSGGDDGSGGDDDSGGDGEGGTRPGGNIGARGGNNNSGGGTNNTREETGGRGRGRRGSGRGAGNAGGSINARAAVVIDDGSDRTTSSGGSIADGAADSDEAAEDDDRDSDGVPNPDNSSVVLYSEVSDLEDRRSESGDGQEELGDPDSYGITEEQEQNMMANTDFFEPSFRRNMCEGWKLNLYIQSILAEAEANNTGLGPTALFDPDEKPTPLLEFSPNKRRRLGPKFRPHNVYAPFQFLAEQN